MKYEFQTKERKIWSLGWEIYFLERCCSHSRGRLEECWANLREKQIPENEVKILSAGHWQERFHLSKFQFVILPSKSNTEGLKQKILPHFLIQCQQTFDFHISLWGEIRRKREHRTAQLFILKAQSFLSWIVFCANAFGKVTVWDNLYIHCMQLRQTSEQKYLFRGMLYVLSKNGGADQYFTEKI